MNQKRSALFSYLTKQQSEGRVVFTASEAQAVMERDERWRVKVRRPPEPDR